MLVRLILSQRSLKLPLFFSFFFFIPFHGSDFHHSVFSTLIHSSASFSLLLIRSTIFLISVIVFFNSVWLLFIFSDSLLKSFYNFSLCAFILFLSYWITFTIIILNSFSGRSPISTSLSCSCVLSCSFICNIFLCHLILFTFLFVFSCMW